LGNWKNPESVRRAARDFWGASGGEGIRWLVSRLRDEVQVEAIHAASSLLARLGEAAIGPAIEELANAPTPDQALALLNALGSLGAAESRPTLEGALADRVLADFLQHDDPDLREAAASWIVTERGRKGDVLRPRRPLRFLGKISPAGDVASAGRDGEGKEITQISQMRS